MNQSVNIYSVLRRRADATAFLDGSKKYPDIVGRVWFYQLPYGVIVRTEAYNLPRPKGACDSRIFAFHIHAGGVCQGTEQDPFADAGTHYNPGNCPHPYHAGDLPPLFGAGGRALSVCLTDRFTVREIIGKTVIIHASADDFTTQPSGNSGEKIACGVITSLSGKRNFRR